MNQNCFFVDNGSVTSPAGFLAAGVTAGFKRTGAPDFAVLRSEVPAVTAGAFTSCVFAAAPVRVSRRRLAGPDSRISAVIINSGIANACTGTEGERAAEQCCLMAAEKMGLPAGEVLPASTGRIGVQLDLDKIARGLDLAVPALSSSGGPDAARAIMTTDTVPKTAAVRFQAGGRTVTIGAMTKGAGMIDPHLKALHATMLCFVTTDAAADRDVLTDCLESGTGRSFNRITVDGDMSTNDTVLLLANGKSGVTIAKNTPEEALFREALEMLLRELARRMVADGEGATKFVEIRVVHASSCENARLFAESVANSLLCKTAWFGNDPNWGRIAAALGYAGVEFDPEKVDIFFGKIPAMLHGGNAGTTEEELAGAVREKEFTILIDFHAGEGEYWVWTTDISHEYVNINADYHT